MLFYCILIKRYNTTYIKVIMYLEFGFRKGVGSLTFGVIYWQQLVNCFCQLFR